MIYSNRLIKDGKVRLPILHNPSYVWKISSSPEGESYLMVEDKSSKEVVGSMFLPMPNKVDTGWQCGIVESFATSLYAEIITHDFNLQDVDVSPIPVNYAPVIPLFG